MLAEPALVSPAARMSINPLNARIGDLGLFETDCAVTQAIFDIPELGVRKVPGRQPRPGNAALVPPYFPSLGQTCKPAASGKSKRRDEGGCEEKRADESIDQQLAFLEKVAQSADGPVSADWVKTLVRRIGVERKERDEQIRTLERERAELTGRVEDTTRQLDRLKTEWRDREEESMLLLRQRMDEVNDKWRKEQTKLLSLQTRLEGRLKMVDEEYDDSEVNVLKREVDKRENLILGLEHNYTELKGKFESLLETANYNTQQFRDLENDLSFMKGQNQQLAKRQTETDCELQRLREVGSMGREDLAASFWRSAEVKNELAGLKFALVQRVALAKSGKAEQPVASLGEPDSQSAVFDIFSFDELMRGSRVSLANMLQLARSEATVASRIAGQAGVSLVKDNSLAGELKDYWLRRIGRLKYAPKRRETLTHGLGMTQPSLADPQSRFNPMQLFESRLLDLALRPPTKDAQCLLLAPLDSDMRRRFVSSIAGSREESWLGRFAAEVLLDDLHAGDIVWVFARLLALIYKTTGHGAAATLRGETRCSREDVRSVMTQIELEGSRTIEALLEEFVPLPATKLAMILSQEYSNERAARVQTLSELIKLADSAAGFEVRQLKELVLVTFPDMPVESAEIWAMRWFKIAMKTNSGATRVSGDELTDSIDKLGLMEDFAKSVFKGYDIV